MKKNLHLIKLFVLLTAMVVGSGNVWGNSASFSKSQLNTSGTWGLNHGSFKISGGSYSSEEWNLCSLKNKNSKSFSITWAANSGSTITVTKVSLAMIGYGTSAQCQAKINGGSYKNIGSTVGSTTTIEASSSDGLKSGMDLTVYCSASIARDIRIKSISVTYTITPNKPGLSPTEATVNVTLNANNPTNLSLTNYFSTADHFGSYWGFGFSSNPSNKGVISGSNFYATEAGTYKVYSYIQALDNCHVQSSNSSDLTITVNRLNPTLTYNNANLDISVSDADKTTIDLNDLKTGYTGNGTISYSVKSGSGAHLSGSTLYATSTGTIVVTATASQTGQYNSVSKDITITVQKRTPVISWQSFEHIYAGDILNDVASASYNSQAVSLVKTYAIKSGAIVLDENNNAKLHVSKTITAQQNAEVQVTTTETDYYKSVVATHSYTLEPKATPVFYLNGNVLPTNATTNLNLEIGQTANVSFELTEESTFEYPKTTSSNYFSYVHNASNHTGVITATKYGDETFAFHQKGTTTIFDHTCNLHIYVSKHVSTLTTTLVDGTWKVDSLYTGSVYSSNDPNSVIVSSSDEKVLKVTSEGIKAVGAGEAVLYIRQAATNEWTGDTISVNVHVEKYTPVVTWNVEDNLPWGSVVNDPVVSTNTELPFTLTSNATGRANYVNGQIEVYNNSGNVTFTFAQEGNYKWNAVNVQKTVLVYQPQNHLPFTLSGSNYNDIKVSVQGSVSWSSEKLLCGNNSLNPGNWDDKYAILGFTGVPLTLTLDYAITKDLATDRVWYVEQSADKNTWSRLEEWTGDKGSKSYSLNPSSKYVKLCYSGNYGGFFSNVKVTERKEVVAPATCAFDAANVGAQVSKKNISVDWYNVQTCTLTISGTDADLFTVNKPSIASSLDNYGTETIEVSCAHSRGGSHAATLTIESADGKSATVALSGMSNKLTPTITWAENLSPMEKGATKANPAQAAGLVFSYTSSDSTVVDIIDGTTIKALKKGSAEITASYDGSEDVMWNSAESKTTIQVTDIKVLRIDWPQSFTNLKTDKADVTLNAKVYYYNLDDSTTILIDRPITFTSQNTSVVTVVDNKVHIVGVGETTITATVEGEEGEFIGTSVVRKVKVREPSEGCDIYVLEDASGSLFTEVSSFSGVEKVIDLAGEPASITFDAWSEKWYAVSPSGNLKLAEYYDGAYHTIWDQTLNVGTETSYGPIALNRNTTKIKFFKEVGSTCYHNFASAYVTLAKYLELDNTANKTSLSVDFPESETSTGVTYTKYVDVNFSNISDVMDVDIKQGTHFSVLKQDLSGTIESIGEDCGDKGKATIAIQFMSNEVKNYKDTITISNKDQSVSIYLSAEVARHDQTITWNPTTDLKTTDEVVFDATTTATDLYVTYAVKGTSDVAAVSAEGELTIYKSGQVTIVASQAGNEVYKPATDVEHTFNITRVTPTIISLPVATEVILPETLAGCALSGGEASVAGSFAWSNTATTIERGNAGYEVTFTPENQNYYTTTTCNVIVPVAKDPQTITWNFTETTMFCNANVTFNATATSGLKVTYTTSDASIAYVDDANKLCIIKGGEVTITAHQEGDVTWAVAPDVSKVLTINRFTPTVVELPEAGSMLIGQLLSNSILTGGRAELDNQFVPGTYAWENGNTATVDVAGTATRTVIFSPQNSNYYNSTTCEVEVEVKKYAPTITCNLSASAITYGQALSESVLSGTLTAMDEVKYPHVEVAGTYTWKEPTKQLNAGNRAAVVRFTPENLDWYDVVDVEVSVVINKAQATAATAVSTILYGQILEEAVPENTTPDAVSGVVEGTMKWDLTGEELQEYPTIGNHEYPVTLTITDPNYINTTISGTCILTVEAGYAFDGHNGTTSWSDPKNWKEGSMPTNDGKVIVMANAVIIDTEVNVGALTIKNDVNVTIENGGKLNVGEYDCVKRVKYGNMIVKEGGQVNLKGGEVELNDLFIQSSLGGTKTSTNEHLAAKSGQIDGVTHLHVNGSAYFDVALDANGACTQGWYDFTVPFPVSATSGVQRFENGVLRTNLKCETNYAIMDYHEDVRAEGKYGWKKYHGIMQPGRCYSITIDNYYNVYRFVKTADGELNANKMVELTATEGAAGGVENKGWNCIGNGTCNYANIAATGISKVQIYDHATNAYSPVDLDGKTFVVGSAIFVQASESGSILFNKSDSEGTLYAPMREVRTTEEFLINLKPADSQNVADKLYLSASEDATDTYEIGHDLSKFGVSSTVAQMWCAAYGMQLCDVELPLADDNAIFPLEIYAPKAGLYTLSIDQVQSGDRLFLLHDGEILTELTMVDYTLQLEKGTNKGYELQLVAARQLPTSFEEQKDQPNDEINKIVINNQLYILRAGRIFDATGNLVK